MSQYLKRVVLLFMLTFISANMAIAGEKGKTRSNLVEIPGWIYKIVEVKQRPGQVIFGFPSERKEFFGCGTWGNILSCNYIPGVEEKPRGFFARPETISVDEYVNPKKPNNKPKKVSCIAYTQSSGGEGGCVYTNCGYVKRPIRMLCLMKKR